MSSFVVRLLPGSRPGEDSRLRTLWREIETRCALGRRVTVVVRFEDADPVMSRETPLAGWSETESSGDYENRSCTIGESLGRTISVSRSCSSTESHSFGTSTGFGE